MRILFFGDVVGRSGREALIAQLPGLIAQFAIDFVVVNAENVAGGFGLTLELAKELFAAGADVLTTGNHVWDQRTLIPVIGGELARLRAAPPPPAPAPVVDKTAERQATALIEGLAQRIEAIAEQLERA